MKKQRNQDSVYLWEFSFNPVGFLSAFILYYCLPLNVWAQADPLYSQYMFNLLPLNPAYAGSQEHLSMTVVARKQWLDIDGAPSTETFSAHSPIKNKNIAIGFSALHDKIGVTSRTGFYGVGAYKINFNNKSKLSFGIQAGIVNTVSKLSQLQTKLPNDPAVSSDLATYLLPGLGMGVYWYSEKMYLGISAPDLLNVRSKKENVEVIHYRHFFLHGGYVCSISSQIKYMPGFLIKRVKGYPLQFDVNNIFIINDVLWVGASYRSFTSVNGIIQAQLTNQLSLGYSCDVPISTFSKLAGTSHEVKLSYKFVFQKDNAFMPRYF
jgi:type IX secretion system PorP/SprF family membrane protein